MANFTKGKTFTSTEELTNTKLHQLVEDASMNVTAITSLTALTDPVADTDTLPIADDSATAIRKVAASNFLKKNSSSIYDAGTTRVTGVATPVSASDATTKAYVDSIAVVSGNLPQVTSGNNGNILAVSGGIWVAAESNAIGTSQIQSLAVTGVKLENSGATAGTYGSSTSIPQITVDSKGRITSALAFNATPADGTVTTAKIVDGSITTAKIADSSITSAKIADGAISTADVADSAITTAKINDAAVTSAKLASGLAIPSQTGNSGKYLTTDGTSASWGAVGGGLTGFRNRIINGDMRINQRNAGSSTTLSVGNNYGCDRWLVAVTGAAVTGQRVAGSGTFKNAYRITGGASNGGVTISQRIEAQNTYDLASATVCVKSRLSASAITSVTWTAYYANTEDTFSSLTQIATGTISGISSTAADYTFSFNAGANAVNGIQITFTLGTMTSGTFDITGVQLESGSTATEFERRPVGLELSLCQRYYEVLGTDSDGWSIASYNHQTSPAANRTRWYFKAQKRAQPTVGLVSGSWSSVTPAIYPSVDSSGFFANAGLFYATTALYALAEL
jgi:hypothetical protein